MAGNVRRRFAPCLSKYLIVFKQKILVYFSAIVAAVFFLVKTFISGRR